MTYNVFGGTLNLTQLNYHLLSKLITTCMRHTQINRISMLENAKC